jgi:hypothetical protein
MKERPILFARSMVRALIAGWKIQTRRVVKRQPQDMPHGVHTLERNSVSPTGFAWNNGWVEKCPYGMPGDKLWVRETWRPYIHPEFLDTIQFKADMAWKKPVGLDENTGFRFSSWCDTEPKKWRPSIHMPRWASRINLHIDDIGVQHIQDISNADALDEGVSSEGQDDHREPRQHFAALWNSINESRGFGWKTNPLVWVIKFSVMPTIV